MKEYKTSKKGVLKNILFYLIIMLILTGSFLMMFSSKEELIKSNSILLTIGIPISTLFLGNIGMLLGLLFEIRCFFYKKSILKISQKGIVYSPCYNNEIIIKKTDINRIYVATIKSMTNHYLAISLKNEIDIKNKALISLFRTSQYKYCIYICLDELDCSDKQLMQDIKAILKIDVKF